MRKFSPLRAVTGFFVAYAVYYLSGIPFLVAQMLWIRSVPLDRVANPPAGYIIAWLVLRSGVNFALGFYAHPALRRFLLHGETLAAMLSFAAALAAVALLGILDRGDSVWEYSAIVPPIALAVGAWTRFSWAGREPTGAVGA